MRQNKLLKLSLAFFLGFSTLQLAACNNNPTSSSSTSSSASTSQNNGEKLSAYTGYNKDTKGRTIYNTDLFYSNQVQYGGPDPQVLDDTARSGYYYLYSTNRNFPVMKSNNLVEWDDVGPTFFYSQSEEVKKATDKDNWAPEVIYDDELGKYLMFFSATPEYEEKYASPENGVVYTRNGSYAYNLYLATSDSPTGPFKMLNFEDENEVGRVAKHNLNVDPNIELGSEELDENVYVQKGDKYYKAAFPHYYAKYCYLAPDKLSKAVQEKGWSQSKYHDVEPGYFGCIDPSPFVDPITGQKYLYFKSEDKSWNVIMVVAMKNNNWLTPDWSSLEYAVANNYYTIEDWKNQENAGVTYEQTTCNEGPHVICHKDKNGKVRYYLSFSVNVYDNSNYQVATAVSDSPLGPFRKLTEEEGGLLICSSTTESQTISGAGHHSYVRAGFQEYIIYHRHNDYLVGGAQRYTAVDELKWIEITDKNGEYLEVPYLNGPTDSIQPIPEKYSDYKNVASKAKVTASDPLVDTTYLTDGLLSVHKTAPEQFMELIGETYITKQTKFTFNFDEVQTLRAIMVYNSSKEDYLFQNISKINLILPDGTIRTIENVKYDTDQYCEYDSYIEKITYSMSGSAAFAEFYDINCKKVEIVVDVPEGQEVGISEIRILGLKNPQIVDINNTEYEFTNPDKFVPLPDEDMVIDGEFDEKRWKESRWLVGVDRINDYQYATIKFTTSYGKKGIYFGIQVQEVGTSIFVNPDRESYVNSSIEMYMAPSTDPRASERMFEFDFVADGTYKSKLNYNGWTPVKISGTSMPVVKSKMLCGEINTPSCTGYQIEAFFPNGFLEFAQYDVEHLDDLILGIDPVHIFSFDYEGTDISQSRYWSQWSNKYIPVEWQNPATFFKFGKDGLIAYDLNIEILGDGKGSVTEIQGNDYVIPNTKPTLQFNTKNGSKVTKLLIDGEDVTSSLIRVDSQTYTYTFKKNVTSDVNVQVTFGY